MSSGHSHKFIKIQNVQQKMADMSRTLKWSDIPAHMYLIGLQSRPKSLTNLSKYKMGDKIQLHLTLTRNTISAHWSVTTQMQSHLKLPTNLTRYKMADLENGASNAKRK